MNRMVIVDNFFPEPNPLTKINISSSPAKWLPGIQAVSKNVTSFQ
jgi:hypothetical protein